MHAQSCFRALECSNLEHSDLDKLMEALFFIRGGSLAQKSPFAARRPCRAAAQDRRRFAGASFGTLTGRRRERLIGGAGNILPCCWLLVPTEGPAAPAQPC